MYHFVRPSVFKQISEDKHWTAFCEKFWNERAHMNECGARIQRKRQERKEEAEKKPSPNYHNKEYNVTEHLQ